MTRTASQWFNRNSFVFRSAQRRLRVAAARSPDSSKCRRARSVSASGAPVHLIFLGLVVLNLVAGFHALGTLMAVGIMVLPAASARFWVRRLGPLVALATGIALLTSIAGLLLSYHADWPTSPVIVLGLGGVYLLSMAFAPRGVLRQRLTHPRHLRA